MKTTADRIIQWQQAHRKTLLPAAVLALGFIAALNVWQNAARTIKISPLLFWGVWLCLIYMPTKPQKRLTPFAILGGIIAFFMTIDPLVYSVDGVSRPWTLVAVPFFLVFALVGTLALCGLSALLGGVHLRVTKQESPPGRRAWGLYFVAMLALWLPVFLAYGPLRISADSYNVIQQALGNYPLTDSHPILYTLTMRLFLWPAQALGNITVGAYLFGFAQMAFLAAVLSYSLYWLRRQGAPVLFTLVALLYFTLSPVFAINGFTAWKDIPFNAVLLLFSLYLYQVAESWGELLLQKGGMVRFLALALAACFLRGNGFYIVLAAMVAIAVLYRRHWKRWLVWFVPFLLAVQIILGPVYAAFGVTRLGGVESAALPLQQVARAVKNGAPLTEEQTDIIESFIPVQAMKDAYVSASPDPIKTHPDFDGEAFDANFSRFMSLWGQLLKTNKQVYLDAWLLQTLGYWKVDFHGWTALTSEYEQPTGIAQHDVWQEAFGLDARAWYQNRTAFLNLSLMAYVALFCAAHLLATGRGRRLLFLLPMLVLWLGMMAAAPAYAEFRYLLLYALGLPALVFITLE